MNVNINIIGGNIGNVPELKTTPSGRPFVNLRVCTNERWTAPDGTAQDRQCWHNLIAWNKRAEVIAKHFKKGDPIFVRGHTKQHNFTVEIDGKTYNRTRYEVVIDEFSFAGGRVRQAADTAAEVAEEVDESPPFDDADAELDVPA